MLDYCAKHQIMPEVKVIHPREVNEAMKALSEQSNPKVTTENFIAIRERVCDYEARYVIDCRELEKDGWETNDVNFDFHSWEVHKNAEIFPEEANWHAKNSK